MENLNINGRLIIPASQLSVTFSRSSGPGGQNVNKVSTKVRLRFPVRENPLLPKPWRSRIATAYGSRLDAEGNLLVTSDRYRDQSRNLADARAKLREMLLAVERPPKPRVPTRPTAGSKRRRLESKRQRSEKKQRRRSPTDGF